MLYLKTSIFILLGALVAACGPREYVATGSVGAQNYLITVTQVDEGLFAREDLSINNEVIFTRSGSLPNDPNCVKTGAGHWLCTYNTSYQGSPVRIEHGNRIVLFAGGNVWYDVFINGELIQRVPIFI